MNFRIYKHKISISYYPDNNLMNITLSWDDWYDPAIKLSNFDSYYNIIADHTKMLYCSPQDPTYYSGFVYNKEYETRNYHNNPIIRTYYPEYINNAYGLYIQDSDYLPYKIYPPIPDNTYTTYSFATCLAYITCNNIFYTVPKTIGHMIAQDNPQLHSVTGLPVQVLVPAGTQVSAVRGRHAPLQSVCRFTARRHRRERKRRTRHVLPGSGSTFASGKVDTPLRQAIRCSRPPPRGRAGTPRFRVPATRFQRQLRQDGLTPRRRNTKRGLRNLETMQVRKDKLAERRATKRKLVRTYKSESRAAGVAKPPRLIFSLAQDTTQHTIHSIQQQNITTVGTSGRNRTLRFATFNSRGLASPAKRQNIERWAYKKKLDILQIIETGVNTNSTEVRSQYIWYFSTGIAADKSDLVRKAQNSGKRITQAQRKTAQEHHGVAILIRRSLAASISVIKPTNGRLMSLSLKGPTALHFITAYGPTSQATAQEIEDFYRNLQTLYDTFPNKHCIIIGGDFNAQLHFRKSHEEHLMGPYIFGKENNL